MNSSRNKTNINLNVLHVVDKLPSLRNDGFFKRSAFNANGSNKEDHSMATDKAKHAGEDETSYSLAEKSTIEEESGSEAGGNHSDGENADAFPMTTTKSMSNTNGTGTGTGTDGTYLQDREVMSMSANSSANFSFFPTGQESMDAYPALYAPDTQAAYEKMKAQEEEQKFQDAKWAPLSAAIHMFKGGMSTIFSYLERVCSAKK